MAIRHPFICCFLDIYCTFISNQYITCKNDVCIYRNSTFYISTQRSIVSVLSIVLLGRCDKWQIYIMQLLIGMFPYGYFFLFVCILYILFMSMPYRRIICSYSNSNYWGILFFSVMDLFFRFVYGRKCRLLERCSLGMYHPIWEEFIWRIL